MILLGIWSVSKANFFSLWFQLIKRDEETLLPGNAAWLVAKTVASARHLEYIEEDLQHHHHDNLLHLIIIMTVIRSCHQLINTTIKSTKAMHFANDFPMYCNDYHSQEMTPFNSKIFNFFHLLYFTIFTSIPSPSHPLVSRGIKDKVKKYQPPHSVSRSGIWTQQQPKKWHFSETEESSVRPSSSVVNLARTSLSRKGLDRPATNPFAAHHQDARHRLCESQLCTCCILMTWPKAATWCDVRRVRRRLAKISRTIARRLSWSSKWFYTGSNSW